MKCDLCNKPAVVHETTVRNGIKKEVHLCEEHASAAGITLPGQQPINQLLTQYVICKSSESGKEAKKKKKCPTCGTNFRAFRQSGVLGCADCYRVFEAQLAPMIERAQNGGMSHVGKCPKRGGASIDRQLRIQQLSRELEDAVAAEQYERAAQLRDRLRDFDTGPFPDESAERSASSQPAAHLSRPEPETREEC